MEANIAGVFISENVRQTMEGSMLNVAKIQKRRDGIALLPLRANVPGDD